MSKRTLFLLCICVSVLGACSWANRQMGIDDDNVIESYIEDVIESRLGLPENSIDLTPDFNNGNIH